jgi:hypothetical protein
MNAGGTPHEVPAGSFARIRGDGEPEPVPQAETTTATISANGPNELARRRIGRVYRPSACAQFSSFETSRTAPLSADIAIAAYARSAAETGRCRVRG